MMRSSSRKSGWRSESRMFLRGSGTIGTVMGIPLACVALATAAGCGSDGNENEAAKKESPATTYNGAARAILESRCLACHVAGGVGPIRLDSYASAKAAGKRLLEEVEARRMPPFPPSAAC